MCSQRLYLEVLSYFAFRYMACFSREIFAQKTGAYTAPVFSYHSAKGSKDFIADFIFLEKFSAYCLYIKVCNI